MTGSTETVTSLWIGLGGALGAVSRYASGVWLATSASAGFPWTTFGINVSGSFLLGFLHRALPAVTTAPATRGFLTIGLCGGFTTFSTFDLDTFTLLGDGRYASAALYSTGSVIVCVAGVLAGLAAGTAVHAPGPVTSTERSEPPASGPGMS